MSRPFPSRNSSSSGPFVRVNGKIRAREVRVIAIDGKQLGVIPLNDALQLARANGVELRFEGSVAGGIPILNQSFRSLDLRRNPDPEYRKLLVEWGGAQRWLCSAAPAGAAPCWVTSTCARWTPGRALSTRSLSALSCCAISGLPVVSCSATLIAPLLAAICFTSCCAARAA